MIYRFSNYQKRSTAIRPYPFCFRFCFGVIDDALIRVSEEESLICRNDLLGREA